MGRISIAGTLGVVGVFGLGFAALRNASETWDALLFMLMVGLLLGGLLGAMLLGRRGAAWVGFALFGWGYLLICQIPPVNVLATHLPYLAARWVFETAYPPPPAPSVIATASGTFPDTTAYIQARSLYDIVDGHAMTIGLWLSVLAFALVGSLLGAGLSRRFGLGTGVSSPPQDPR